VRWLEPKIDREAERALQQGDGLQVARTIELQSAGSLRDVAIWAAVVAVTALVAGVVALGDILSISNTRGNIAAALLFLSVASALVAIVATVALAIRAVASRTREHS
jgi:hypothetical protein